MIIHFSGVSNPVAIMLPVMLRVQSGNAGRRRISDSLCWAGGGTLGTLADADESEFRHGDTADAEIPVLLA